MLLLLLFVIMELKDPFLIGMVITGIRSILAIARLKTDDWRVAQHFKSIKM